MGDVRNPDAGMGLKVGEGPRKKDGSGPGTHHNVIIANKLI